MRIAHRNYEHKHRSLRIQYLVAPDCLALRRKRPGMAWQQLRANAALLIDWLRVLQRAGRGTVKAVVGEPIPNGGSAVVKRPLRIRAERLAVARVPVGPAPPLIVVPPAA